MPFNIDFFLSSTGYSELRQASLLEPQRRNKGYGTGYREQVQGLLPDLEKVISAPWVPGFLPVIEMGLLRLLPGLTF